MAISLIILAIIVIGVIVVALEGVSIYNGLIRARNTFRNAFAQIDAVAAPLRSDSQFGGNGEGLPDP